MECIVLADAALVVRIRMQPFDGPDVVGGLLEIFADLPTACRVPMIRCSNFGLHWNMKLIGPHRLVA